MEGNNYPDEVALNWKRERDAALAEVERLKAQFPPQDKLALTYERDVALERVRELEKKERYWERTKNNADKRITELEETLKDIASVTRVEFEERPDFWMEKVVSTASEALAKGKKS